MVKLFKLSFNAKDSDKYTKTQKCKFMDKIYEQAKVIPFPN